MEKTEWILPGIAASPGIGMGKAAIIGTVEFRPTEQRLTNSDEIARETALFRQAVEQAKQEIESVLLKNSDSFHKDEISILETQVEFIADPGIAEDVEVCIKEEGRTASDAVIIVINIAAAMLESMPDEYLRGRAADIRDAGKRILGKIGRQEMTRPVGRDIVWIADELSPTETISLKPENLAGFATHTGGRTSHTAIVAKAKGIPAVLGCGDDIDKICDGDIVIIDGSGGELIVNPERNTIERYLSEMENERQKLLLLNSLRELPAVTTDNEKVTLLANISSPDEIESSFEMGAEGTGLLRTELLFMGSQSFPTEEEQYQWYLQAALRSKGRPVIIRTLDIGGDKLPAYFRVSREENPFLGYRGIRISLGEKEQFIIQLRAILRAAQFGDLRLMFPMISTLEELRRARSVLETVKSDLHHEGISFKADVQAGIMIETPAAAIMADALARESDFFSIGTNDLCQYTLAVDRMNEKVNELYDPFHPAVLRLISQVIKTAVNARIEVGLCGELASQPLAIPLLLGLGLREFSMSAPQIPVVKQVIRNLSAEKARTLSDQILLMDTAGEIKEYLKSQL